MSNTPPWSRGTQRYSPYPRGYAPSGQVYRRPVLFVPHNRPTTCSVNFFNPAQPFAGNAHQKAENPSQMAATAARSGLEIYNRRTMVPFDGQQMENPYEMAAHAQLDMYHQQTMVPFAGVLPQQTENPREMATTTAQAQMEMYHQQTMMPFFPTYPPFPPFSSPFSPVYRHHLPMPPYHYHPMMMQQPPPLQQMSAASTPPAETIPQQQNDSTEEEDKEEEKEVVNWSTVTAQLSKSVDELLTSTLDASSLTLDDFEFLNEFLDLDDKQPAAEASTTKPPLTSPFMTALEEL